MDQVESGKGRKLKAESSHPESPAKKNPSAADVEVPSSDDMEDTRDVKSMFMGMMQMMKSVKSEMNDLKHSTKTSVDDIKSEVKEVKQDIERVESSMDNLTAEHDETKARMVSLSTELAAIKTKLDQPSGANSKSTGVTGGKAGGKSAKKEVDKKRTLRFSNFPNDTQENDIIHFIEDKLTSVKDNIEEAIFAYSKTGTAGAAKFKSEELLWEYMSANKGHHEHYYKGQRIYLNAGESENFLKDKAVRKVVRLLHEKADC